MTVCIGALCDTGRAVVVASDCQVTLGAALEIEHPAGKINPLVPGILVMTSGDRVLGAEVIEKARERLASWKGTLTVRAAAETLCTTFKQKHRERVESVVLVPRGYTFDSFHKSAAQQMSKDLFEGISKQIFDFGLNAVEFLVCGIDASGAHLFRVFYTGLNGGDWMQWLDSLTYYAIGGGQGAAVARLAIERQGSALSIQQTLFNVFAAKKTAEIAPGVGRETDVVIVTAGGAIELSPEQMRKLERVWTAHQEAFANVKGLETLPDGTTGNRLAPQGSGEASQSS
jgi:20S proteasome alpha/beta subunit